MKNMGKKIKLITSLSIVIALLAGCGAAHSSAPVTVKLSTKNNSLIKHHNEHQYKHGTEGYYNLLEDGVEFELVAQRSGTCWACAAACSMMTSYQMDHDGKIDLDQMEFVDALYDDDKEEGVFVGKGVDKADYGGSGHFVMNEFSNGFVQGLVVDNVISAAGWSMDELKEGIKKYGALYVGIPDPAGKKGTYDNYYTLNTATPDSGDYDHSIAVLGWDDNFPKEYFHEKASEDGAWITYNSANPLGYYYVSYDTPFDQEYDTPLFLSVTEGYSEVLYHDHGCWTADPVVTGDSTTTANVFKEKGTLSAIGTYALSDDTDITIQIMTADLTECLYSQDHHVDLTGYYVFELDKPMEVDEFAVAVTYSKGAPVEGESLSFDDRCYTNIISKSGESFILMYGKWLDMSDEKTWELLGRETNNACIKALFR